MARYISERDAHGIVGSGNASIIRPFGFLGVFGLGFFYYKTGSVLPAAADRPVDTVSFDFEVKQNTPGSVRVRCVGAGGPYESGRGDGGGGGYCHGTFSVTPGQVLNCHMDSTSSRVLLEGDTLLEAFSSSGGFGADAQGGVFQATGADAQDNAGGASGSQFGDASSESVPFNTISNDQAPFIRFPFDGFSDAQRGAPGAGDWGNGGRQDNSAGIGGGGHFSVASSDDFPPGPGIIIIEW